MKLSIVIAAYNVEKFITKCIISCYDKILENDFEIIVINDGSTDNTGEIIATLLSSIPNLKLINKKNTGLGAARNTGIQQAKGEYLWFVDGDDYIAEGVLSLIFEEINRNDLDALVLNYSTVDDKYRMISNNAFDITIDQHVVTGSVFYRNNYEKSYSCFFIFRKALFIEFDVFFKERINMQDSEILPKLLINVNRLSFFNKTCYYYVQHPDSFTNTSNGKKRLKYFESMIEVKQSLQLFLSNEAKNNVPLTIGLEKKILGIHHIIFNHLVFFKYEKNTLKEILRLLRRNNLYPLKFAPMGKMIFVKLGLNSFPILTKLIVDKIQELRK